MADRNQVVRHQAVAAGMPAVPEAVRVPGMSAYVHAPGFAEWMRATFIEPGGPLHNRDHLHLRHARIAVVLTSETNAKQGRTVLGTAALYKPAGADAWSRGMRDQLHRGFFGRLPDFVVTLFAPYLADAEPAERAALVEHELYHCAQALDDFGAPRFRRGGGPIYAIRPHDVEEFVGVVRRYGADAAHVRELVDVAERGPTIAPATVHGACGTCGRPVSA